MVSTRPLTAVAIAKIARPGRHSVGNGVYLQITGRGRSWVFRYERAYEGKRRGRHVGAKGLELRRLLTNGVDPLDYKRAARQQALEAAARVVTFRECGERYIAAHETGWRNAVHRKQWQATLVADVYPMIGELAVASVDTTLVVKVLEAIWTTKPQPGPLAGTSRSSTASPQQGRPREASCEPALSGNPGIYAGLARP